MPVDLSGRLQVRLDKQIIETPDHSRTLATCLLAGICLLKGSWHEVNCAAMKHSKGSVLALQTGGHGCRESSCFRAR